MGFNKGPRVAGTDTFMGERPHEDPNLREGPIVPMLRCRGIEGSAPHSEAQRVRPMPPTRDNMPNGVKTVVIGFRWQVGSDQGRVDRQ
jgi:hypothetical protein